jgi:molybdopterin/thiamine biosynthesis adenylyltransferase
MSRYARQITVPGFGSAAQDRLRAAHVLVVGAGGLAAPVLQYLTGAGVGKISIVDPDDVSLSNLHRQTVFAMQDIGLSKSAVAARQMSALNPEVAFVAHSCALDPANVGTFTQDIDLVLDCADSFAVSYILSDLCLAAELALISASVVGLAGYCGGFCRAVPSLRAVFPDLPDRMTSCAKDGVLGPVVGVIGGLQAQMAVAVLAEFTPSPLGQLVTFDATDFRFGGFRFDTAAEPDSRFTFIAPEHFVAGDFILDLRAATEGPLAYSTAVRALVSDIGPDGPLPQPGQRAVLCCQTGSRAWQAAERLTHVWSGHIVLAALAK